MMNLFEKKLRDKRGVSVILGYVLLISTAIILSVIVFQWMRSYVPRDATECPTGVSISVLNYEYSTEDWLNLTLKNNGNFNIGGFFIRASNKTLSEREIATIGLEGYVLDQTVGQNAILFTGAGAINSLQPGYERKISFDLSLNDEEKGIFPYQGEIYFIEIIPTRWIEIDGRDRFVSCGNSRIIREI